VRSSIITPTFRSAPSCTAKTPSPDIPSIIVQVMNSSTPERFEAAYRRIWGSLNRPDDPDLAQHERQLLHHIPARGGVSLTWLARHLLLPKSSASVLVKSLERRGFVARSRVPDDERKLAIILTPKGRRRVAADTVLDSAKLGRALAALSETTRHALIRGVEQLAARAEEIDADAEQRNVRAQ
jgi:DNA-binding MarR family transcriptional regulator